MAGVKLATYYRYVKRRGEHDLDYIPVWLLRTLPPAPNGRGLWGCFNRMLIKPVHGGRIRWVSCVSVGDPLKQLPAPKHRLPA